MGIESFLDLLLHFGDITEETREIAQVVAEMPCRVRVLGHLVEAGFGDGDGLECLEVGIVFLSHGNSIAEVGGIASIFNSFLTCTKPTRPIGKDRVDTRIGQLMVPTVFIGNPNGFADHFFDHAPSASIEGDLLSAFVSLSHGSIIADCPLNASPEWPFYSFFLRHKSLSINELRRGGGALPVTRLLSTSYEEDD